MAISVPEEKVYYYRSPTDRDIVLCWLPRTELDRLIKEGKANESIVRDYPRGLDIRLCETEIEYHKTVHSLDLGTPCEILLLAFEAIQESDALPGQGIVRGQYLDRYAKRFLLNEGVPKKVNLTSPFRVRQFLHSMSIAQRYFDNELKAMTRKPLPDGGIAGKRKALEKLAKPKLLRGDHPFKVASRLQQRQMRRK